MSADRPLGRVLVTGGAGFIGSRLLRRLLPLSEHVTVIDDCSTGIPEAVPPSGKIDFIRASYVDEALLDRTLPGTDYVFHVACRNMTLSASQMDEDFQVNLYGGYLLLKKVREVCPGLRRFLYTSTASVYGNAAAYPTAEHEYETTLPYAASKLSMEHYAQVFHRMHGLPVTVLRLSNVYGPGQTTANPYCGVIAKFFDAAEAGEPFPVYGDGRQTRDFTYIEDVLDAIVASATREETAGGVYNVGTGVETSVIRLAHLIADIAGGPRSLSFRPPRTVDVVRRRCLDASLLRREIGWRAGTSIEEGLRLTHLWRKGGGDDADLARND